MWMDWIFLTPFSKIRVPDINKIKHICEAHPTIARHPSPFLLHISFTGLVLFTDGSTGGHLGFVTTSSPSSTASPVVCRPPPKCFSCSTTIPGWNWRTKAPSHRRSRSIYCASAWKRNPTLTTATWYWPAFTKDASVERRSRQRIPEKNDRRGGRPSTDRNRIWKGIPEVTQPRATARYCVVGSPLQNLTRRRNAATPTSPTSASRSTVPTNRAELSGFSSASVTIVALADDNLTSTWRLMTS